MSKGDGFSKVPGTKYLSERILEATDFYRYQVISVTPTGSRHRLAMFRYKKHSDHFKAYLEVPNSCGGA